MYGHHPDYLLAVWDTTTCFDSMRRGNSSHCALLFAYLALGFRPLFFCISFITGSLEKENLGSHPSLSLAGAVSAVAAVDTQGASAELVVLVPGLRNFQRARQLRSSLDWLRHQNLSFHCAGAPRNGGHGQIFSLNGTHQPF